MVWTKESADYIDLLSAFNAEGVEYLIVGAHALALYGYQRYTKVFDIWVRPTSENARRVYAALSPFGAPLDQVLEEDFADDDLVFQIGVEPVRIDIITAIEAVSWDEAWPGRLTATFGGQAAGYIGMDALIKNKRATGRERDRQDIEELLKIRNAPKLD